MRVRLTVMYAVRIPCRCPGSVDREAGETPARTPLGKGGAQKMTPRRTAGLAAGTLAFALLAAPVARGAARPVTVDLRIEGPTRTLFEGRVTTGVRPFRFTGDPVAHECDGTAAANGGVSSVPVPTRGAAVAAAAASTPFAIKGKWFDSLGPSFSSIRGEKVSY